MRDGGKAKMKKKYYTKERNVQIVIAILKANGIRKVIVSPGTTNMTFVGSVQHDPFFEIYSSADERSAAYMACGMAEESREPVVISCTGATASRNYYSGLTEAYYRKLPILAITSHQGTDCIGHLIAQNIDRRQVANDIARLSVDIPVVHDKRDEHFAEMEANKAVLELFRRGGGPVHINLHTHYCQDFSVKQLPSCRIIRHHSSYDNLPSLPSGKIAIFVGSHKTFTSSQKYAIEAFCAEHDSVVFCDHTSGYYGKYRIQSPLLFTQCYYSSKLNDFSLLIHIGEVSGDYTAGRINQKEVWRVNQDGETRDTFNGLTRVFEMPEEFFFKAYTTADTRHKKDGLVIGFRKELDKVMTSIPDLGFSNIWIAQQTAPRIPVGSRVHLGILNTLRTWNFFEFPDMVESTCNVGGFGIDGAVSSLIGASLANSQRLCFGVFGDLAFFYDMNVLANRHVGKNVRILLINNGKGAEFEMYNHPCSAFGEAADPFMAAAGHYGNKSPLLVKHYAEDLGYEYLTASNKDDYLTVLKRFVTSEITEKPMILEAFTNSFEESDMLKKFNQTLTDPLLVAKRKVTDILKNTIGKGNVEQIKKVLN